MFYCFVHCYYACDKQAISNWNIDFFLDNSKSNKLSSIISAGTKNVQFLEISYLTTG